MREKYEDYMKRRLREEDEKYKQKLIFESPDKGKTIYSRPFGEPLSYTVPISCPEEQKIYDYLDVKKKSDNFYYDGKEGQIKKIEYKYDEPELINEFRNYIDTTYREHYSKDKFQATEFIMDGGHGTGFCIGNVLKYAQRYGKKGTREDARKDIMKVLHYALMQLYVHDSEK